MATWEQSGSAGGLLGSIGQVNTNAPQASDINATAAYIRDNNDRERAGQNNMGLQLMQGLGGLAQTYQKAGAAQQAKDFQSAYGQAYASGDRNAMRQLAATYPGQMEAVQKGMGFIDDDQRDTVGNLAASARLAASNPEMFSKWLQNNAADLDRVGVDPKQVAQMYQQDPKGFGDFADHLGLSAVGPDKYFDIQDKIVGRQIDQGKLAEQVRSNQAGESLTARGQNITARGQDLSYQSSMTGHNLASQRLALDKQEFGLKVQQAQQKAQELIDGAPKLSVNMEKGIETAVNNATASSNSADSMSSLAQQFRQEKPTTGLFGNANNMFSKLTGSETALRDLRIRQNSIVNSQVLKFLPPGPATDRDVALAREGAPSTWDDPEIVANWLDANARLERRNAQFNEFKSEWMSANGNPGQSRKDGQILGQDIRKGESLGSAAKRYMANNPISDSVKKAPPQQAQPQQAASNQSQQQPVPQTSGAYTSKSGIQFKVE